MAMVVDIFIRIAYVMEGMAPLNMATRGGTTPKYMPLVSSSGKRGAEMILTLTPKKWTAVLAARKIADAPIGTSRLGLSAFRRTGEEPPT